MKRTWKPKVAGILCIAIGSLIFIPSLLAFGAQLLCTLLPGMWSVAYSGHEPRWGEIATLILVTMTTVGTSLFAIIGGINALQRKKWSRALAGSICAVLAGAGMLWLLIFLGFLNNVSLVVWIMLPFVTVPAIVIVAVSKKEFA